MSDDMNDLDLDATRKHCSPEVAADALEAEVRRLRERVAEREGGIRKLHEMLNPRPGAIFVEVSSFEELVRIVDRYLAHLLDTPHAHGIAQKWCDECGDCVCTVTPTTELDPVTELPITLCDETGCPLHDTPHSQAPAEQVLCTDGFHHCGHWRDGEACCACGDERDEREG